MNTNATTATKNFAEGIPSGEVLHKSSANLEEVICPDCQSKNHKKLFSSFSASTGSSSGFDSSPSCTDGSCGVPSYGGGCANGMCNLN